MNKTEQQREHFNTIADRYFEARQHANHLRYKELMWKFAFDHSSFRLPESARVLEPMCGYAEGYKVLRTYCGNSFRYHGFDYSDSVIERLRHAYPELSVDLGDVTTFRSDEKYDVIVLIGGLHHVPEQAKHVVASLAAALAPGGHFVNLEPTSGNWLFRAVRAQIYTRNSLFDEETERAFGVEELHDMFHRAGLEPCVAMYPGLLAYVMYYNPDAFPALNRGSEKLVETLFNLEKRWYTTKIAKLLSFATLSIWRKPGR